MLVSEALAEVQTMLCDASGFDIQLPLYLRHLNKAITRFAQSLDDSARTTLNLVASQQQYDLPVGLRSINKIQLVPENSTSTTCELLPIRLEDIPVFTPNEKDPTHFYLQISGGSDSNTFGLFVWPTPARSATDAIVIDYTPDYEMTLGTDVIPFPNMLNAYIVQYSAGSLLMDRVDDKDRMQGADLQRMALDNLVRFRSYQPVQYMAQTTSRFP